MAADANANIRINIDSAKALADLKNLQKQISQFHRSVAQGSQAAATAQRALQTNLINSINSIGSFSAELRTVRTSAESFTNALEKNKLSLGQYFRYAGASTKTFGKNFVNEFNTIEKVAQERVKTLQTQYIKLGRDASGAMQAIAVRPSVLNMQDLGTQTAIAAQKQALFNQLVKQGSTNLLNFGKNTQWAGRQLMVGFTIPLIMLGSVASKTFMDMEKEVIKFRKVYGDMFTPEAETTRALNQVKELGAAYAQYGVAVKDVIGIAGSAAAAGFAGVDLQRQTEQAVRLSILGQLDYEKALETTISLQNAFRISSEDLGEAINFLNAVENQTVVQLDDITTAIPKVAPVIQALGGDVKDLAFFLAAMKEGGVNASEGANALKSGLARMINPTQKAVDLLGSMGINLRAIVGQNAGDLKATVMEFATALDALDPLSRSRAIEQVFGRFQFARISTLFANITREGSQAARVAGLAQESVSDLAQSAENELGVSAQSAMNQFLGSVERLNVALAPVGEIFLEILVPFVETISQIVSKFNDMPNDVKKAIGLVVGLVGGLGPVVLMTFGLMANGIANGIKFLNLLRNGYLRITGQAAALGAEAKYMTQEHLQAAAAAASLDQAHAALTQRFTAESQAVMQLRSAYEAALASGARFAQLNPGFMARGYVGTSSKPTKRAKGGIVPGTPVGGGAVIVGGTGSQDSELALLMPGEAVLPTAMTQKYGALINAMIADNVPGYSKGKIAKYKDSRPAPTPGGRGQALQNPSAYHAAHFVLPTQTDINIAIKGLEDIGATGSRVYKTLVAAREEYNKLSKKEREVRGPLEVPAYTNEVVALSREANLEFETSGRRPGEVSRAPASMLKRDFSDLGPGMHMEFRDQLKKQGLDDSEINAILDKVHAEAMRKLNEFGDSMEVTGKQFGEIIHDAYEVATKLEGKAGEASRNARKAMKTTTAYGLKESTTDDEGNVTTRVNRVTVPGTKSRVKPYKEKRDIYAENMASQSGDIGVIGSVKITKEMEKGLGQSYEELQATVKGMTAQQQNNLFTLLKSAKETGNYAKVKLAIAGEETSQIPKNKEAARQQANNTQELLDIEQQRQKDIQNAKRRQTALQKNLASGRYEEVGDNLFKRTTKSGEEQFFRMDESLGQVTVSAEEAALGMRSAGQSSNELAKTNRMSLGNISSAVMGISFAIGSVSGLLSMLGLDVSAAAGFISQLSMGVFALTTVMSLLAKTTTAAIIAKNAETAQTGVLNYLTGGVGGFKGLGNAVKTVSGIFKTAAPTISKLIPVVGTLVTAFGILTFVTNRQKEQQAKIEALGNAAFVAGKALEKFAKLSGFEPTRDPAAYGAAVTASGINASTAQAATNIRATEDFKAAIEEPALKATIDALREATLGEASQALNILLAQMIALAPADADRERIKNFVAAIAIEAGKTDVDLSLGISFDPMIEGGAKAATDFAIAQISESSSRVNSAIQEDLDRLESIGARASGSTTRDIIDIDLKENEAALRLDAAAIGANLEVLRTALESGQISLESYQAEIGRLASAFEIFPVETAQFIAEVLSEKYGLDPKFLSGIQDATTLFNLLRAAQTGVAISSGDLAAISAGQAEGASIDQIVLGQAAYNKIVGETSNATSAWATAQADLDLADKTTELKLFTEEIDNEIKANQELTDTYHDLIDAGVSEAEALAMLSDEKWKALAIDAAAEGTIDQLLSKRKEYNRVVAALPENENKAAKAVNDSIAELEEQKAVYQWLIDNGTDVATAREIMGDATMYAAAAEALLQDTTARLANSKLLEITSDQLWEMRRAGLGAGAGLLATAQATAAADAAAGSTSAIDNLISSWGRVSGLRAETDKLFGRGPSGGDQKSPFEEAIESLKQQQVELTNTNIAYNRLRTAGFEVGEAFEAAQNPILAAAIASTKVDTPAWERLVGLIKEVSKESQRLNFEGIFAANRSTLELSRNFARIVPTLVSMGFELSDINQLLSDPTIAKELIDSFKAGEFSVKLIRDYLEDIQALRQIRLELELSTPEGMERAINQAFSDIDSAFSAMTQQIELDFAMGTNLSGKNIVNDEIKALLKGLKEDPDLKLTSADIINLDELNVIIAKAGEQIAAINYQIDDQEALLKGVEEQEEEINKQFEERIKALDAVEKRNADIAKQQKAQLDISDALSTGDIAAAARAVQQARAESASAAIAAQKERLEKARESALSGVRAKDGRSREEIEASIKDLKDQIFEIEEKTLEPAERALQIAESIKGIAIDSLDYLGKNKLEWDAVKNSVDMAKISADAYKESIRQAILLIEQLKDAWAGVKPPSAELPPAAPTPAPTPTPTPAPTPTAPTLDTPDPSSGPKTVSNVQAAPMPIAQATRVVSAANEVVRIGQTANAQRNQGVTRDTPLFNQAAEASRNLAQASGVVPNRTTADAAERRIASTVASAVRTITAVAPSGPTRPGTGYQRLAAGGVVEYLREGGKLPYKALGGIIPSFLRMGGKLPYKAKGGLTQFIPKGTDTVPAMLTPGEYVIRKRSVDKLGIDFLDKINQSGEKPGYFFRGGPIMADRPNVNRAPAPKPVVAAKKPVVAAKPTQTTQQKVQAAMAADKKVTSQVIASMPAPKPAAAAPKPVAQTTQQKVQAAMAADKKAASKPVLKIVPELSKNVAPKTVQQQVQAAMAADKKATSQVIANMPAPSAQKLIQASISAAMPAKTVTNIGASIESARASSGFAGNVSPLSERAQRDKLYAAGGFQGFEAGFQNLMEDIGKNPIIQTIGGAYGADNLFGQGFRGLIGAISAPVEIIGAFAKNSINTVGNIGRRLENRDILGAIGASSGLLTDLPRAILPGILNAFSGVGNIANQKDTMFNQAAQAAFDNNFFNAQNDPEIAALGRIIGGGFNLIGDPLTYAGIGLVGKGAKGIVAAGQAARPAAKAGRVANNTATGLSVLADPIFGGVGSLLGLGIRRITQRPPAQRRLPRPPVLGGGRAAADLTPADLQRIAQGPPVPGGLPRPPVLGGGRAAADLIPADLQRIAQGPPVPGGLPRPPVLGGGRAAAGLQLQRWLEGPPAPRPPAGPPAVAARPQPAGQPAATTRRPSARQPEPQPIPGQRAIETRAAQRARMAEEWDTLTRGGPEAVRRYLERPGFAYLDHGTKPVLANFFNLTDERIPVGTQMLRALSDADVTGQGRFGGITRLSPRVGSEFTPGSVRSAAGLVDAELIEEVLSGAAITGGDNRGMGLAKIIAREDLPGISNLNTFLREQFGELTKSQSNFLEEMLIGPRTRYVVEGYTPGGAGKPPIWNLGAYRYAKGGKVRGYALGGPVVGRNKMPRMAEGGLFKSINTDTVPAMLTPGEFVVRKFAVQKYGTEKLKAINNGTHNDGSVYNYSVSVNVKSDANPDQIARAVMTQIKQVDSQRLRSNRF
jgi:TP901 family phage tail tape measure protein